MKKIISILLVLVTILSFVGCSNNSIEERIVSDGKKSFESLTLSEKTISISTNNNEYVINVAGQGERTYYLVNDNADSKEIVWTNIQEITSLTILETVNSSKQLIINYINESLVLKDKEELISYINDLPVKSADFPNDSLIAAFDPNHDTVFINIQSNLLDKHTIVHELFHALSNKTRGNSKWIEYCTTIFDEAFTELLASSVIKSNYATAYDNYIKYVYQFIGYAGLEGISSYFYGLDEIQIPSTEFHFYTMVVECLTECTDEREFNVEELTLYYILSKWGLEK